MKEARRLWCIVVIFSILLTVVRPLQWNAKTEFFGRRFHTSSLCINKAPLPPSLDTPAEIFQELKSKVIDPHNITITLRNLIQFGDQWIRSDDLAVSAVDSCQYVQSELERVPGCTSTVKIRTSYASVPRSTQVERTGHSMARVEGSADSRVTQGMLAILCKIFNTLEINTALNLSATAVTAFFGIDAMLPTGRQNTFHNMIVLIQAQLRKLVDDHESTNTISVEEKLSDSCNTLIESMESQSPSTPVGQSASDKHTHSSTSTATAAPPITTPAVHDSATACAGDSITGTCTAKDPRSEEVAVLLSGGVDSSVALKLLLEQGHKVRAYYLKIWLEDELAHLNSCPWEEDLKYAQAVCDQLGVPLETVSLQKEYWRDVVQYTLQEAQQGRTPNPDIMCNSRVKFGTFYDYVGRFHSKIASGHYAQVKSLREIDMSSESLATSHDVTSRKCEPEDVFLLRSPDAVKDQSYFLCNLRQEQLRRCLFPIGHLQKNEVRRLAENFELPTMYRRDSQGICFLGKLKFDDFIEHYLGQSPGVIRSVDTGEELGQHRGLWFHTLGQRKGLGALMKTGTVNFGPWYVCAKDMRSNTLLVSNVTQVRADDTSFVVENVNWINSVPPELTNNFASGLIRLQVEMKLRHSPVLVDGHIHITQFPVESSTVCTVRSQGSPELNGASVTVRLQDPMESVAPGQFVAFYQGTVCIGSGVVADLPVPAVPDVPDLPVVVKLSTKWNRKKQKRLEPSSVVLGQADE